MRNSNHTMLIDSLNTTRPSCQSNWSLLFRWSLKHMCIITVMAAFSACFIHANKAAYAGVMFSSHAVSVLLDQSGTFIQVIIYPTATQVSGSLVSPHFIQSPAVFSSQEFHNLLPPIIGTAFWVSWDPCGGYIVGVQNLFAIVIGFSVFWLLSRRERSTRTSI
jgi:hypothetical protein